MNQILIGDCLELMPQLMRDGVRVQTCITSPPYFGLRDYGTASWDGGDPVCDHVAPATGSTQNKGNNGKLAQPFREVCRKCGAIRIDSQLGLEPSPAEDISKMVDVFRLVHELLADDGTLWLNMGDSYAGSWGAQSKNEDNPQFPKSQPWRPGPTDNNRNGPWVNRNGLGEVAGFKPKDLMGIPWRLALALQADGWYLRIDIIWHKPNPMPESVTDRPTKSHEYIFLLSKSEQYFYDADAIKEKAIEGTDLGLLRGNIGSGADSEHVAWHAQSIVARQIAGIDSRIAGDGFRNKRSVWTVPTSPYSGAHFATFPPDLILPCVLAGSRPGDIVFDPFMGSGTTALVAKENGRRYLGCELNPAYSRHHRTND